jgi:Intracellular proteinase inhibitor
MAQTVRMSEDFLPLEVGNLWRYEITDRDGRSAGIFEMEILQHVILDAKSFYVFSRFPFGGEGGFADPIGIRYDPDRRQYLFTDGQQEGDLFPAAGVTAEIMETDDAGGPRVVRLTYPTRTLALERGVGVIAASDTTTEGRTIVSLVGARIGREVIGEMDAPPAASDSRFRIEAPTDNVVLPADTAPVLEVEAIASPDSHRFVLRVHNPTGKLMPFDFTTSQSFDFVVADAGGQVVWRWAERRFFSQVTRSEAIRVDGTWEFEGEWNHRDSELDPVPAGTYSVRGVLTATEPFQSDPVEFEVE